MNVAAPQSAFLRWTYGAYMAVFFFYLAAPLAAAGVFAFNDSLFPSLPWNGFTLDWFFGDTTPKVGMFFDRRLLRGLENSFIVAMAVSAMSVAAGTCNAFLFERREFPGKELLYILMVLPLVIPGVILGISILVFASAIANGVEDSWGWDWAPLRPGLILVILGQFSFITTITSLVIAARLRKFDIALEEAAFNLGATRVRALATVTLPFLAPGPSRLVPGGVPGLVRELQHDADAGRLRRAPHHHHVRPHGEGRIDARPERRLAVPDDRVRDPRADQRVRATRAKAGGARRRRRDGVAAGPPPRAPLQVM